MSRGFTWIEVVMFCSLPQQTVSGSGCLGVWVSGPAGLGINIQLSDILETAGVLARSASSANSGLPLDRGFSIPTFSESTHVTVLTVRGLFSPSILHQGLGRYQPLVLSTTLKSFHLEVSYFNPF